MPVKKWSKNPKLGSPENIKIQILVEFYIEHKLNNLLETNI